MCTYNVLQVYVKLCAQSRNCKNTHFGGHERVSVGWHEASLPGRDLAFRVHPVSPANVGPDPNARILSVLPAEATRPTVLNTPYIAIQGWTRADPLLFAKYCWQTRGLLVCLFP